MKKYCELVVRTRLEVVADEMVDEMEFLCESSPEAPWLEKAGTDVERVIGPPCRLAPAPANWEEFEDVGEAVGLASRSNDMSSLAVVNAGNGPRSIG